MATPKRALAVTNWFERALSLFLAMLNATRSNTTASSATVDASEAKQEA